MTSIKDVARTVGVSTATVSRALRGLPRVSDETRVRVLKAAAELDYVASPSAAGLASGQTRAVGVIVPFVTRWFYASVVQGAEELLREAGYDLLLYNLGVLFEDMGRTPDAVLAYEAALAGDPDLADGHYNLALLYERLAKPKDAIRHMARYRMLTGHRAK